VKSPKENQNVLANDRGGAWRMALCLAVVTLAVFWQATQCDFVNYDDNDYVTSNSHVQEGLTAESIHWAFTADYENLWMPLTWLSHMADWQIYRDNAWGHHLTSVLLHTANTVLLFLLLRFMTGSVWRSALVAALFALHPLHVETAAWVSERKGVLSTFFWLLTLWAYARYARFKDEGLKIRSGSSYAGTFILRLRFDDQADRGDAAFCAVVAGLLATGTVEASDSGAEDLDTGKVAVAFGREDSVSFPSRHLQRGDVLRGTSG
jgi:hypothetical protein